MLSASLDPNKQKLKYIMIAGQPHQVTATATDLAIALDGEV